MSKLPNTRAAVLQRVTAPQYDTTRMPYRHLNHLQKETVRDIGRLLSMASAVAEACDNYAASIAEGADPRCDEAEMFLQAAGEPMETLVKALVEKGMII